MSGAGRGARPPRVFMAEHANPAAPDLADLPDSDEEVREPPRFVVLMHNDHYTTMEFVVSVLERIFYKSPSPRRPALCLPSIATAPGVAACIPARSRK